MGCSSHLPEGPRRAGGDPAPGNVAITRLPEAGVREHPAPLGALRQGDDDLLCAAAARQGAPRTARCIKTRGFEPRGGHSPHVRDHPALLRHQLTTSRADHGDQLKGLEQAGT